MTEIILVSEGRMNRRIDVSGGESADMVLIVFPGISCDVKLDVNLNGEGAAANIYGAYICGDEEKVNIAIDMHHKLPHCNSRQLFKGIAGGHSKVDFYGKIIVACDAQKTEAYQENHNLLLTKNAKIYSEPQLEIYADDVKCSHGATNGSLDENELFYLRSRGIPYKEAQLLQQQAFAFAVLDKISTEELKDRMISLTEQRLRGEFSKCKNCCKNCC